MPNCQCPPNVQNQGRQSACSRMGSEINPEPQARGDSGAFGGLPNQLFPDGIGDQSRTTKQRGFRGLSGAAKAPVPGWDRRSIPNHKAEGIPGPSEGCQTSCSRMGSEINPEPQARGDSGAFRGPPKRLFPDGIGDQSRTTKQRGFRGLRRAAKPAVPGWDRRSIPNHKAEGIPGPSEGCQTSCSRMGSEINPEPQSRGDSGAFGGLPNQLFPDGIGDQSRTTKQRGFRGLRRAAKPAVPGWDRRSILSHRPEEPAKEPKAQKKSCTQKQLLCTDYRQAAWLCWKTPRKRHNKRRCSPASRPALSRLKHQVLKNSRRRIF